MGLSANATHGCYMKITMLPEGKQLQSKITNKTPKQFVLKNSRSLVGSDLLDTYKIDWLIDYILGYLIG